MNVKIQSVKFDADQKLVDFIEAKLAKLERFDDKIISSNVILKLDKDHDNGNKVVTVNIDTPGNQLVAERRAKSFEEAFDECIDAIKKQIEKQKDKKK